jgi:hypothetical protein
LSVPICIEQTVRRRLNRFLNSFKKKTALGESALLQVNASDAIKCPSRKFTVSRHESVGTFKEINRSSEITEQ